MDQHQVPDSWQEAIAILGHSAMERSGRLTIVTGAGLGKQSGLPDWPALVEAMAERLGPDADAASADKTLMADLFQTKFERGALVEFLVEQLSAGQPSDAHRLLAELGCTEFYTTNYECLLETALRETGREPQVVRSDRDAHLFAHASVDRPVVVKLNGCLQYPETLSVTSDDFSRWDVEHANVQEHLKEGLKYNDALFVGVSFGDPQLRPIRDRSRAELGELPRQRFVIRKPQTELLAETHRRLGLEIVEVSDWSQLPDFLRLVRDRARRKEAKAPAAVAPAGLLTKLQAYADSHWDHRLEEVAGLANDGLYGKASNETDTLLGEMDEADTPAVPPQYRARAHLLAAQLALLVEDPTSSDDARLHMGLAEQACPDVTKSGAWRCLRARLRAKAGGVVNALADLEGDASEEGRYTRFLLAMDHDRLDICRDMVQDGGVDLSLTPSNEDVARLAAMYHAAEGHGEETLQASDALLRHQSHGRNLTIAASSLKEAAEHRYTELCRVHGLPLGVPLFVDVDELSDAALLGHSAELLAQAAEWYRAKGSADDSVRNAEFGIRIATRLGRLDLARALLGFLPPGNWAAALAASRWREEPGFAGYAAGPGEVAQALCSGQLDAPVALGLLVPLALGGEAREEAASLLAELRDEFVGDAALMLDFAWLLTRACLALASSGQHIVVDGQSLSPLDAAKQCRAPADLAWFPPLLECQVHLESGRGTPEAVTAAQEALRRARELSKPDNPELLWGTYHTATAAGDHRVALAAIEQLIGIARTPRTVECRTQALAASQQWEAALAGLDEAISCGEIPGDNLRTHLNRATALFALRRDVESIEDLTWILENAQAAASEADADRVRNAVLNLAIIHRRHGRYEEAARTLERADRELGRDDPAYLMAAAQALLASGQADRAYLALERGAARFGGRPEFDVALMDMGFRTNNERRPAAVEAQRRTMEAPDGVHTRRIRVAIGEDGDLGELGGMLRERMESARQVETLYRCGALPFVALACAPVIRAPVCELWWRLGRDGAPPRYVAVGTQQAELQWLELERPDGAVVDYTALLLLDELLSGSGADPLEFICRFICRLYVPETLRALLDHEQVALQPTQPSRDAGARRVVQLLGDCGKLRELGGAEGEAAQSAEVAARRYSVETGALFVSAFADREPDIPAWVASPRELVEHLGGSGRIQRSALLRIGQHRPTAVPGQPPDWSQVDRAGRIVTDEETLRLLDDVGALSDLCRWATEIAVPARDWRSLQAHVRHTEWTAHCRERFERLRVSLEQRREAIEWVPVSLRERRLDFGEGTNEEWEIAWDYFADLFNVALKVDRPLWTDDRATRILSLEAARVQRFGTDTLLAYGRRTGTLSEGEWEAILERLLAGGYLTLQPDADYLYSLVAKGERRG